MPDENVFVDDLGGTCPEPEPANLSQPTNVVYVDDMGGTCPDPEPQPSTCPALYELFSCIQNYLEVNSYVVPLEEERITKGENFQVTIAIRNTASSNSRIVFIDPILLLKNTEYAEVIAKMPRSSKGKDTKRVFPFTRVSLNARLSPGNSLLYTIRMKAKKETNYTTCVCNVSASAKVDIETLFRVPKSSEVRTNILLD
ncbi:MAG: hypothetical protein AB1306_08005 [Nitrospirota bacterium]